MLIPSFDYKPRRTISAAIGSVGAAGAGLLLVLSLAGWWLPASQVLGLCLVSNLLGLTAGALLSRRPPAAPQPRPELRRSPSADPAPLRVNPFFDLLPASAPGER